MADDDGTYLVWSNEHRSWWKPGGYGYSPGLRGAGHFTREHAIRICREALPTASHIGAISEVPVRMEDIAAILKDQMVPRAVYGNKDDANG
jgi:hypothetical protein